MDESTCTIEGCVRPIKVKSTGWCSAHYQRAKAHGGDPLAGRTPVGEPLAFFRSAIQRETDECIIWPYKLAAQEVGRQYGQVWLDGKLRMVHVLACEERWGPAADATMQAAHGPCHNPRCFNPRHVSWKTQVENMADQFRDGTRSRNTGEMNGSARLTETDVVAIRAAAAAGVSQGHLAKRFGVSSAHVNAIVLRKKWAHVP